MDWANANTLYGPEFAGVHGVLHLNSTKDWREELVLECFRHTATHNSVYYGYVLNVSSRR